MTDEQIIYLSPEEDLTKVRERLEQTQARRIILVIPPQTQLRSHVGWRVLHSRMRELSKDVLVISSDRQVRAVAKAAGFRVADSQESPAAGKSRPPSRPGRTNMGAGGKMLPRSRQQPGKGAADNRPLRQREQPGARHVTTNERQLPQQPLREPQSTPAPSNETFTGTGKDSVPSTFDTRDRPYGSTYDYRIETSPPIRPVVPRHEDEEPDHLIEDYHQAQFIRQRYQHDDQDALVPPIETREPSVSGEKSEHEIYHRTPAPGEIEDHDPFAYMEDNHPASLPEQRASARVDEVDAGVPDISDVPTDILDGEIEDLGDEGDILLPPRQTPSSWSEPGVEEPDITEIRDPSHYYGMRPRSSRSGTVPPPRQPISDIDDEDMLPPIPDQLRLVTPPPPRQSGALAASAANNRVPQPLIQPAPRNVPARSASRQTKKQPKDKRSVVVPPSARSQGQAPGTGAPTSRRRNNRATAVVLISLLLLFLLVIALLYFGPSATVTITLPSQNLSMGVQLNTTTNPHDKTPNTVLAQVLTFDKSVTDQGIATGAAQVGINNASGNVIFTNKGTQPIDIPTGTVLSTSSGIQFVTMANALIPPVSSNNPNPPVPVQAQNAGQNGNVAANSITTIPASSLTQIQQDANNAGVSITPTTLTVTNPQATMNGGAGNATAVSNSDISTLEKTLHQRLQSLVSLWLSQNVHKGDIQGSLTPDVLKSSSPIPQEKLTAPQAGQLEPAGKFTEALSLHLTTLVVRAADLKAAVSAQLNAAAMKIKPAFILVSQQSVTLDKMKSIPSKDGNALVISLVAVGQIVQRISEKDIGSLLASKSVSMAKSDIQSGAGIHGVLDVNIQVFPGFLSMMPFIADHIHVIVKPAPPRPPIQGVPNG